MNYKKALKIYENCIKKENDKDSYDKKWELYSAIFPLMIKGEVKVLEFDAFCRSLDSKEEVKKERINNMSEEEALKMLNELENKKVLKVVKTGGNI